MRRKFLAVAFSALLLASCSNDRQATDQLTVVADQTYNYTPLVMTVPSNTPIDLTFTADGMDHTFVVKDAIQDGPIDVSDGLLTRREIGPNDILVAEANAGETVTATFTMQERGAYLVYCKLPEHRDNGMFATLIVE